MSRNSCFRSTPLVTSRGRLECRRAAERDRLMQLTSSYGRSISAPISEAVRVRTPLILGIGGTPRPNSTSERAMRAALAVAARFGAETVALTGPDLLLPMYAPDTAARTRKSAALVKLVHRCDGLIRAGPGYLNRFSASISGASAGVRLPSGVAAG